MTTQVPALSAMTFGQASRKQGAQDRRVDQRIFQRRRRIGVIGAGDRGTPHFGHFFPRAGEPIVWRLTSFS